MDNNKKKKTDKKSYQCCLIITYLCLIGRNTRVCDCVSHLCLVLKNIAAFVTIQRVYIYMYFFSKYLHNTCPTLYDCYRIYLRHLSKLFLFVLLFVLLDFLPLSSLTTRCSFTSAHRTFRSTSSRVQQPVGRQGSSGTPRHMIFPHFPNQVQVYRMLLVSIFPTRNGRQDINSSPSYFS